LIFNSNFGMVKGDLHRDPTACVVTSEKCRNAHSTGLLLSSDQGDIAMTTYPRDMIGYGATPPDPKWPNGARLALNFVLNFEEGSEASFADGDGYSEAGLTEASMQSEAFSGRDLAAESMFEYGSRVGFWRVMRLFQERHLPLTIFGCALALERHPPAAQAIAQAGHDVCCHGWRWMKHFELEEEEEREHIRKAIASLQQSVGTRPLGWYCRYGPSVNTRRLLVEEGGFLYDSDAYNDELPYWVEVEGKRHLVVPYTLGVNDSKFGRGVFATGTDFYTYAKDSFDMLYREGEGQPKMMSVGLHMRIIGHPGRAAGLERFLDHVLQHNGVWVCRREEIAQHWMSHHSA
jgi:allantoinase